MCIIEEAIALNSLIEKTNDLWDMLYEYEQKSNDFGDHIISQSFSNDITSLRWKTETLLSKLEKKGEKVKATLIKIHGRTNPERAAS